jgi:hypothetical protein
LCVCVCVFLSLSLSLAFCLIIGFEACLVHYGEREGGVSGRTCFAQCDNLRACESWGKDLATNVGYSSMLWRGNHFPLFSSLALIASLASGVGPNPLRRMLGFTHS